jgi:transposase
MAEGTWVGLDVHARKTVAGVLDASTGELRSLRAPTLPAETVGWLQRFPAPVRVAYEAGPTGYGLARACVAAGIPTPLGASRRPRTRPAGR